MNHPAFFRAQIWLVLAAVVSAVGGWEYMQRVLVAHQVRYAAAYGIPRGNLSDLYPRWLGTQELLLHGRDPYSVEVTREIQTGFYSRPLDSDPTGGRNYQQGFYYPVYVAFFLAPTIHLQFERVREAFFWILLGLTLATIPLWLRALGWRLPLWVQASMIVFTIGSLPVIQGLKLQQITLFVVAVLAVAMALLNSDHPIPAGILLAFATIKPQLVVLLLLWLMIWTLGDWRRRYPCAASFLFSMAILFGASEWYFPHWIPRFWRALLEYHSYTGEMSVMEKMMGAPSGTALIRGLQVLVFAVTLRACFKERSCETNTDAFAFMLALVLAATTLLVPTYGLYNQVLLIPALLIILKINQLKISELKINQLKISELKINKLKINERRTIGQRSLANRVLTVIVIGLVSWPWISCIALAVLSFVLPGETVERGWAIPFWTALQTPVAVSALMLLYYYQRYYQRA